MKMVFRWFGKGFDSTSLEYIRQIPGIHGVVTMLSNIPVGETWPLEKIFTMKRMVEAYGLSMEVVESVNVHEDIKLGLPNRDQYISNYIATLSNLGKAGVRVVCYNFMPLFDWIRTELSHELEDGSKVLYYDGASLLGLDPATFAQRFNAGSNGYSLPGWEPERLSTLESQLDQYRNMTEEELWKNLEYFLKAIIPEAEHAGIKMAIHPDDPPWSVFGLLRIIRDEKSLERVVGLVNSPSNGIALCSGALGADEKNDIPSMIRRFGKMDRIPFAHVRNVMRLSAGQEQKIFYDAPHPSFMGSLDMYEIMRAYSEIDYEGYLRPDHGRMIWGENSRPGYGFYDRALGVTYLLGLWEALRKGKERYHDS